MGVNAVSEPYFAISASAPFSPIPLTPLMLSDASPIIAFTSTSCAGATPYSAVMRAGS